MADLNRLFYQQDDDLAYNGRVNNDWLNTQFVNSWIGTSGPIKCLAYTMDLTSLDFWLWVCLQDWVYLTRSENVDILRQNMINIYQKIHDYYLLNVTRGVIRRCAVCAEHCGGQIEQLL